MRLVIAAIAATLVLTASARANERACVSSDPAEWESGPDAYLLWTHPHAAADGGFAYDEPDLTCSPRVLRRQASRRIWRRHRLHVQHAYARAAWVNVPMENLGGRCPMGDCLLIMSELRKHPA